MKLTKNLGDILEGYLKPSFPAMPPEAALLIFLTKLSQVATYRRLKINDGRSIVPANIYSILFLETGAGKDRATESIDAELLKDYHLEWAQSHQDYLNKVNKENKIYVEEHFPKSSAERDRWLKDNSPRHLQPVTSKGTPEGLISQREAYSLVAFGGTFIHIPEFADFISTRDDVRSNFLSLVTEIYDMGNNEPAAIKGEKISKSVKGVPNTVLFYSSPSGLLDNEFMRKKLSVFLARGLGRRCFVCLDPKMPAPEKLSFEENKERKRSIMADLPVFINLVSKMVRGIKFNEALTFGEGVEEAYFYYDQELRNKRHLMKSEIEKAEATSRSWRAIKMACIITKFEDPSAKQITLEAWKCAIGIAEEFTSFTNSFKENQSELLQVIEFFKENLDKRFSLAELKDQNFVAKNQFSRWFSESLPYLIEMARKGDHELIEEHGVRNTKYYRMVKLTEAQKLFNQIDNVFTPAERRQMKRDMLKRDKLTDTSEGIYRGKEVGIVKARQLFDQEKLSGNK